MARRLRSVCVYEKGRSMSWNFIIDIHERDAISARPRIAILSQIIHKTVTNHPQRRNISIRFLMRSRCPLATGSTDADAEHGGVHRLDAQL